MNQNSRFLRQIVKQQRTKLLTYDHKYYLSPSFYRKVSPVFAKGLEEVLSKKGTVYKTKEEFEAAKKPIEYL